MADMPADENTPLLRENAKKPSARWSLSAANRVLLAGFITSLSFGFTQVPIFYVFHLMECDVFYGTHPPYTGGGDRCGRNEIAAGTATQFSILGMSTAFCGTWNLFVTGMLVKRWGPRAALVLQTVIPAVRVAAQILGVVAGGRAGIVIIQCTQLITVLGGPSGYILVVNTIAGEVVAPLQRTAVFGRLQGSIMLGTATGFLLGGAVGDAFGIRRPFETAFFLFLGAAAYARLAMPHLPPESSSSGGRKQAAGRGGGLRAFVAPLRVLAPQTLRLADGRTTRHRGILFLCCGVFLGVLATGYAPVLLQMHATAVFAFSQADNGRLMSGNAAMRSLFLLLVFPQIIARGRRWWFAGGGAGPRAPSAAGPVRHPEAGAPEEQRPVGFPTNPEDFDERAGMQSQEEPVAPVAAHVGEAVGFDLVFLRWSLLVDGALTSVAAFATTGWHVYLAAFLIPFGSGTAPAAKGVITEMCPSSQRADALNAITLVENIARLSTLGLFGFLFSAFAEIGRSYLTFFCNAAIAVVGMAVLWLSHFPPAGSSLIDETDESGGTEGAAAERGEST